MLPVVRSEILQKGQIIFPLTSISLVGANVDLAVVEENDDVLQDSGVEERGVMDDGPQWMSLPPNLHRVSGKPVCKTCTCDDLGQNFSI